MGFEKMKITRVYDGGLLPWGISLLEDLVHLVLKQTMPGWGFISGLLRALRETHEGWDAEELDGLPAVFDSRRLSTRVNSRHGLS